MSTTAIFGSYVLSRKDGAQDVLRDHWVLVEGKTIAAVTRDKPSADQVYDRPGEVLGWGSAQVRGRGRWSFPQSLDRGAAFVVGPAAQVR